jgi:hypothetical protein
MTVQLLVSLHLAPGEMYQCQRDEESLFEIWLYPVIMVWFSNVALSMGVSSSKTGSGVQSSMSSSISCLGISDGCAR